MNRFVHDFNFPIVVFFGHALGAPSLLAKLRR
jgi:hypothetical protein